MTRIITSALIGFMCTLVMKDDNRAEVNLQGIYMQEGSFAMNGEMAHFSEE